VVVFRKSDGVRAVNALRRDLAGRRFDLAINLNIYFKSIFPTVLSRAPHRLGFDRGRARDAVWLAANHHLLSGPRKHTQDLFLEFADMLGLAAEPLEWRLEPTAEEMDEQARFFDALGGEPAVGIVPASANAKKDWPAERYPALVDALHAELGLRTVLIGGPGARETEVARHIMDHAHAKPIDGMGDGVRRLIWLTGGCRLLIAPDTGPVHIAPAHGVPVVGLYAHTNPWRVAPSRAYEDLWVDRYNEPGASADASVADPRHERMELITVRDIVERAAVALERYPAAAR
jgi:heptosyltransferase I